MDINDLNCPDMSTLTFKDRDDQMILILARHRKLPNVFLRNNLKTFEISEDANDIAEIIMNRGKIPKKLSDCSNKDLKQRVAKYFMALADLYYENLAKRAEYKPSSAGESYSMRSDSDWDKGISSCCRNGNCGCSYPI